MAIVFQKPHALTDAVLHYCPGCPHGIIHRLAGEGVAVIVLSSEAQEIMRVCDRSLVLFHGRHAGEVAGEDMNEHNIMYLATGGNTNEKAEEENGK